MRLQPGAPITLCRDELGWFAPSDLPDYCGSCPFWQGYETSVPGIPAGTGGICALRNMNKDRYADTPQNCRRFFGKTFRFPSSERLVVGWKDDA